MLPPLQDASRLRGSSVLWLAALLHEQVCELLLVPSVEINELLAIRLALVEGLARPCLLSSIARKHGIVYVLLAANGYIPELLFRSGVDAILLKMCQSQQLPNR